MVDLRDERQDLRHMRERLVGPARVPQRVADARLGRRGSQRLGLRVHLPPRRRGKLQAKLVIAGVFGHLRCAQQQRRAIGARHLFCPRNPLPPLERALQMNDGLGVGVQPVRLRSGPDRRRERGRQISRGIPVVCRLGVGIRALAGQLGRRRQVSAARRCSRSRSPGSVSS
jgi:hypothetical protein